MALAGDGSQQFFVPGVFLAAEAGEPVLLLPFRAVHQQLVYKGDPARMTTPEIQQPMDWM